jgi:hypothetical protein
MKSRAKLFGHPIHPMLVGGVTGLLGRELGQSPRRRLEEGANLDAPNSLTGRPARG